MFARTFTIYCKPLNGLSVPISPLNQQLAIDSLAVSTDLMYLRPDSIIEAEANGDNVTILITGKEIPIELYETTLI